MKIRRYRIEVSKKYGELTGTVKVVMIGDLHNKKFGDGNASLVEKINAIHPDMILSVGDLTVCHSGREVHPEVGLRLMKRLSLDYPIFCIHGNHELRTREYPDLYRGKYEEIKRGLNIANVFLLEDDQKNVDLKGFRMTIHGLDIPLKYYEKRMKTYMGPKEIRRHIQEPQPERYNILLAHNPMFFESYALWGAELTCSGHFHGGMMRLPFLGGVISPQLHLFPKYDCGLFEKYDKKMLVTAGLGTHSFAPRINNPAELTVIEFCQEKEPVSEQG